MLRIIAKRIRNPQETTQQIYISSVLSIEFEPIFFDLMLLSLLLLQKKEKEWNRKNV